MQAQDVLSQLQAAGVVVSLQEDGHLRAESKEPLTDEDRAYLASALEALPPEPWDSETWNIEDWTRSE